MQGKSRAYQAVKKLFIANILHFFPLEIFKTKLPFIMPYRSLDSRRQKFSSNMERMCSQNPATAMMLCRLLP
jgi:hypothetical protein